MSRPFTIPKLRYLFRIFLSRIIMSRIFLSRLDTSRVFHPCSLMPFFSCLAFLASPFRKQLKTHLFRNATNIQPSSWGENITLTVTLMTASFIAKSVANSNCSYAKQTFIEHITLNPCAALVYFTLSRTLLPFISESMRFIRATTFQSDNDATLRACVVS